MLESWKVSISFTFALSAQAVTCLVVIIVNDRLPDRKEYPPLPDIILDNLPYASWGSTAAEMCLLILTILILSLTVVHKNRAIMARRVFALMGTMYLLRCVCIIVTSVPVPDPNKECDVFPAANIWHKLFRAFQMFSRMGVAVMGNRTCGDYIFSGHTAMLTILNLFLNEYTPKSWKIFHFFCWTLNIMGMFFILLHRGHYSIDVVVAFYISFQMFGNYHALAESRLASWRERRWSCICFPLLTFFESESDGPVANELCWPNWKSKLSSALSV
ncbi:hypothetical protein FSP39_011606 [Pinctada imbricata]|uniref:Sphingomyelin synthase-like domain-containing protein n=1 Tax=Pinctada imbricata TaxID=66713 RepID=A0AA89C5A3_PINIB|nr:hypothetical protein FSP39_011606 [Pinctada imbricata]